MHRCILPTIQHTFEPSYVSIYILSLEYIQITAWAVYIRHSVQRIDLDIYSTLAQNGPLPLEGNDWPSNPKQIVCLGGENVLHWPQNSFNCPAQVAVISELWGLEADSQSMSSPHGRLRATGVCLRSSQTLAGFNMMWSSLMSKLFLWLRWWRWWWWSHREVWLPLRISQYNQIALQWPIHGTALSIQLWQRETCTGRTRAAAACY